MKLYIKECRRIATSIIYYLFIAILVFSWFQNFRGVTKTEINWANGIVPVNVAFDHSLLAEPSEEDKFFGSKCSDDDTEAIMTGVTRALLMEYEKNSYSSYPLGYYKAITLSGKEQAHVMEILCEITGLTEEQLKNLPQNYFPAVTGTIISSDAIQFDKNENIVVQDGSKNDDSQEVDKTKKFISQVTYERFKELMREMEAIIGEEGTQYSTEMMITYFGMSEMTYEEAYAEYNKTIEKDKVTGGFARLFCDYMGLALGLYPIFIVVIMWLLDCTSNGAELLYSRKVSTLKLVLSRYFASVTMVLLPVILLSLESLIPLMSFGEESGIAVDCLAYIKYIFWWLLPTVMIVSAIGMFLTLLTDSPIAIVFQFLWWTVDKGMTGLSGDTNITTLMIRHNTLRGYEIVQEGFEAICMNRLLLVGISILFIALSVCVLNQKRKGRINAANIYNRCFGYIQNKFWTKPAK